MRLCLNLRRFFYLTSSLVLFHRLLLFKLYPDLLLFHRLLLFKLYKLEEHMSIATTPAMGIVLGGSLMVKIFNVVFRTHLQDEQSLTNQQKVFIVSL